MARALRKGSRKAIWELELLTLSYSGSNSGSRSVRKFIESGRLSKFAENNPQLRIETKHAQGRPFVNAKYVSGFTRNIFLGDVEEDEIGDKLEYLRDTCGIKSKYHHRISSGTMRTSHISIQGLWRSKPELWQDPIVNKPLKDDQETKMRKVFQQVNDELGMSGVLLLLQKLKKKESQQVSKIRLKNRDQVNSVARDSLKEYYSKVYVPEVLAAEKARVERLKKAPKDSLYGPEDRDKDEDEDDEDYEWEDEVYDDEDEEDEDDRYDEDEDEDEDLDEEDGDDDDDDDDDWDDDDDDDDDDDNNDERGNFERPINDDDDAIETFDDDDIEDEEDTAISDDDEVLDLGEEAPQPEERADKKKR